MFEGNDLDNLDADQPEEESGNRTFLYVAGGMGVVLRGSSFARAPEILYEETWEAFRGECHLRRKNPKTDETGRQPTKESENAKLLTWRGLREKHLSLLAFLEIGKRIPASQPNLKVCNVSNIPKLNCGCRTISGVRLRRLSEAGRETWNQPYA